MRRIASSEDRYADDGRHCLHRAVAAALRTRVVPVRTGAVLSRSSACGAIGFIDDLLGHHARTQSRLARAHQAARDGARRDRVSCAWIDATTAIYPRDVLFHAGSVCAAWYRTGSGSCSASWRSPGRFTRSISPTGSTALRPGRSFRRCSSSRALATPAKLARARRRSALHRHRRVLRRSWSSTGIRPRCSWAIPARLHSARCFRASRFSKARCCCLILIGGVFVAEALSVIMQVVVL